MRDDKLQEIIELLPYSIRYSGEIEELLDYAREQAERVQDLETINKELHDRRRELRKQNKRYREALEKISAPIYKVTYADMVAVKRIARQALEDGE